MAYFERLDRWTYRPTPHVSGAWDDKEQHIGPSLGLLAHVLQEEQTSRRETLLTPSRLSYEIWGTAPLEPMDISVEVIRPGRTIELVEARLWCAGRTVVSLRAWMLQAQDTRAVSGSAFPPIPSVEECEPWDPTTVWPGGYIASAEVRRVQHEPGRAHVWVRSREVLIDGVECGLLPRAAALFDIINGLTVRARPGDVAFPNVDLTAHLLQRPQGEWLGFDISVAFGTHGVGVTESVLHDETGPIGTLSQILTLRTP